MSISTLNVDQSEREKSPFYQLTSDSSVRDLTKKRGNIKGRLTSFSKHVGSLLNVNVDSISERQLTELKLRSESIKQLLVEFNIIQSAIEDVVEDNQDTQVKQIEARESFENSFFSVMADVEQLLERKSHYSKVSVSRDESRCNVNSAIKLPTITLPTFDGNFDNWIEFRDTFLSIIHNSNQLDGIQKFHYLRSSLIGNALQVIKSIDFSSENYIVAWDLLMNRFNNSDLLVHNHLKSLHSLPHASKDSPMQIRKLIDTVTKNLRALKSLGEPTEAWDTIIIFKIISKLDTSIGQDWQQYKSTLISTAKKLITLDVLLQFLKDKADMLDMTKAMHPSSSLQFNPNKSSVEIRKPYIKTHSLVATHKDNISNPKTSNRRRNCVMCSGSHSVYACKQFLSLSINDKLQFIKEKSLCSNCLREGHSVDDCYFGACKRCHKKHNSCLHEQCDKESNTLPLPNTSASVTSSVGNSTSLHSITQEHTLSLNTVLLSTAIVEIAGNDNNFIKTRALLDCGSQHCIIVDSLLQKLNVKKMQSTIKIIGVGNSTTNTTQSCEIRLRSLNSQYNTQLKCLVLPHITSSLPSSQININHLNLPRNICLADPSFTSPSEIDLLIGADCFWELITEGKIRIPGGPFMQNTQLGWIISGPLASPNTIQNSYCNLVQTSSSTSFTSSIDEQLKRFWELEEVPQPKNYYSQEERACEKLFIDTHKRLDNGRFSVRIPFSQDPKVLGNSYEIAKSRFLSLERKLQKSPQLNKMYCDFMLEYLTLGHMSPLDSVPSPNYFLCHHGVLREQSLTTKLRVVFNASQKTSTGISLNDIQYPGPPLQSDLFSILLRFRQYTYVVCADIEKLFRQTLIQEDQRNFQLILFRFNPNDPLSVYRLNTNTYGTSSAPFLSIRCIRQLGQECTDPEVAKTILNDFYVDDWISGHNDEDHLKDLCANVFQVCMSGCLPLRKWISNSPNVIANITGNDSSEDNFKCLSLDENYSNKTLGLGWLNNQDEFHFTSKINFDSPKITKRVILSIISQIYDPLGFLSPVIIVPKMLMQKLWLCKLDWDEQVPSEIKSSWLKFTSSLPSLSNIRIPRQAIGTKAKCIELHIFVDASETAYGACAYARTVSHAGESKVILLCSKSRVAPLKTTSIPRLELCGALLGSKLKIKIVTAFNMKFDNIVMWTDSTIVLGWLKTSPNLLKPFVQNRTVEIMELTNDATWLHIDGKSNPADLVSRGVSLNDLISSDIWWTGPKLLYDNVSKWPQTQLRTQTSILPELKSSSVTLVSTNDNNTFFNIENISSFSKLQRVYAYVYRFIGYCSKKSLSYQGPLTISELNNSLQFLIKYSQKQSFPVEYHALENNLPFKSSRLNNLNVFMDEQHIIRVGGRLSNSPLFSYNKKHPIVLCSHSYFTILLFRYTHHKLLHAGPQLLLADLRDRYWPLGGRNLAKRTVKECIRCKRMTCKPPQIIMGDLPKERLMPGFPFLRCGVDYAGPFYFLNKKGRGSRLEKCYLCLFVCFSTRALHLELVTSLSSEYYILALKRFISRRGKPLQIFSDNGTNFVGAMKEFSNFITNKFDDIIHYTSSNDIEFKFIPPYSAHFGGLWEAGVKSCKHHLTRVLGLANLTYEELSTVLAQIEAVLNSRPITPMSSDPNDFSPLTPGHFLIGRPLTAPASDDFTSKPTLSLTRFKRIEQLRQHFWVRWSKEYVTELQKRTKWTQNNGELKINDLVLLKDDNLPPLQWRLGRILSLFPGKDAVSRVADIKTAKGVTRRAFSKICPLLHDTTTCKERSPIS